MKRILFVCEYNACRSQMAEALARVLLPQEIEVVSAGLHPGELNQLTVEVMREIGIDISHHQSKQLAAVAHMHFESVVVLATKAYDATAGLAAKERLLWSFEDPVARQGTRDELKAKIRTVRDALREKIPTLGKKKGV